MTIRTPEAAVLRFELLAMATRIKEIGALCRNEWLLSPPVGAPPMFDIGVTAIALEAHAESLADIHQLPAESALNEIIYPPGYKPPDGRLLPPYGTKAWGIVDRFVPAKLEMTQRYLLCGLIAGTITRCVEEALDRAPLQPGVDDQD